MLFELLPDMFPPYLSDIERFLWARYMDEIKTKA